MCQQTKKQPKKQASTIGQKKKEKRKSFTNNILTHDSK